jgi:hypothetical protein
MDRAWVIKFSPDDLVQLKRTVVKPDDGPNERKPQGQARPNVLFGWAGNGSASRQDGVGQACRPYLSVTAAATNFLRPALPGLVAWAAHQSGNVVGSM